MGNYMMLKPPKLGKEKLDRRYDSTSLVLPARACTSGHAARTCGLRTLGCRCPVADHRRQYVLPRTMVGPGPLRWYRRQDSNL